MISLTLTVCCNVLSAAVSWGFSYYNVLYQSYQPYFNFQTVALFFPLPIFHHSHLQTTPPIFHTHPATQPHHPYPYPISHNPIPKHCHFPTSTVDFFFLPTFYFLYKPPDFCPLIAISQILLSIYPTRPCPASPCHTQPCIVRV